jgi:hypothetical protein
VGAGYGIASPGIFRMPYPLQRGFTGNEVDPVAALIGNALGSFQGVRAGRQAEADRQEALQRQAQQEKDQADWRDLQTGIGLANAGLTNVAPAPTAPTTPTGFTPSGPAMTGPAALRAPDVSTVSQMQTPAPLVSVGGQSLWRAGPSAAEQKIAEADTHAQLLHRKVGHALATQMFGHDVDDDTAEAIGVAPGQFTGFQKFQETPPKNFTPVGEGAGAFDPSTGKVTKTGFTPPAKAAAKAASLAALTGQESRAAVQRMLTASLTTGQLETSNIGTAQPSTWAAALGGITRKIAGEGAGAGVTRALRGTKTNEYQDAADQWVDSYLAVSPKGRGGTSPEFRDRLKRMFFGTEGDSPANIQAKAEARKQATATIARAVATGVPPTTLPGFEQAIESPTTP